jgi:hypothetical protein
MGVVLLSCIIANATIKVRAIFSCSLLQTNRQNPSPGPFAVANGSAACLSITLEPLDSLTTRVSRRPLLDYEIRPSVC